MADGEEDAVTMEEKETKQEEEALAKPNYAVWILTFMTVIGLFYAAVFYLGAGFFYFLSKKTGFKKKNYIPYTERIEQEQAKAITMDEAPPPEASLDS